MTQVVDGDLVKVMRWYDNEWGTRVSWSVRRCGSRARSIVLNWESAHDQVSRQLERPSLVLCSAVDRSRGVRSGRRRVREMSRPMIVLKRVYDPVSRTDGTRLLVERLWPRGISKAKLRVDAWLKEVGPSTVLRKWFGHDPQKWREFRRRYFRELSSRRDAWQPILSAARRGRVTLVYSSHDREHNNAVALQEFLLRKLRQSTRRSAR